MKHLFRNSLVLLLSFLLAETLCAKTLNIAFLNGRSNLGFWGNVEDFMAEVAGDFEDVKLTIYRAESDHFKQLRILEEITSENYKTKYDAVLTRTIKNNGVKLLEITEQNKVPIFLFNSGLTADQISKVGGPRETYKYFIGEMYPGDESAGYDSAKELFRIAKKNNVIGRREGGRIGVLALGGGYGNNASIARIKGLRRFIQENDDKLELLQVIHAHDLTDEGFKVSQETMHYARNRYRGTRLFWGYNDAVSIGAIKSKTSVSSASLLSGGIDWTPEAIELVNSGEMAYTFGGHYMDGGWSLLAVYDYLKGKDFKDTEGFVTFSTRLSVINKENVAGYKKLFIKKQINEVDFTKLSKFRNGALKKYTFSFDLLLDQLQK